MKIKKFDAITEKDQLKELSYLYDKKSTEYYIKFINDRYEDLYTGHYSNDLNKIADNFIKLKNEKPYNFYYILETTKNNRIIPTEELEILINSNKYNI
jgi:hypothetical protein